MSIWKNRPVNFEREAQFEEMKYKAKTAIKNTADWAKRNEALLLIAVPSVCTLAASLIKVKGYKTHTKSERYLKECYCYDNRLGHYWKLKRPLSNREWLTIAKAKEQGLYLGDILKTMNVLK